MAQLKYLVIHCTATPEGREVTVSDIKQWHMGEPPIGRGWSKVGYSDMIHIDGCLSNLTPFNQDGRVEGWELTYGSRGINAVSRHIVYVGGVSKDRANAEDTRTCAQKDTLEVYVKYMLKRHPDLLISGHNQFSEKSCPSFNVSDWLYSIGVKEKNIFTPES
jgi:N-acetylmuramoyl-L-alanine amidase